MCCTHFSWMNIITVTIKKDTSIKIKEWERATVRNRPSVGGSAHKNKKIKNPAFYVRRKSEKKWNGKTIQLVTTPEKIYKNLEVVDLVEFR